MNNQSTYLHKMLVRSLVTQSLAVMDCIALCYCNHTEFIVANEKFCCGEQYI